MSPSCRKECIPKFPSQIKSKNQALNYCILECPRRNEVGCASECEIRKRWKLPPHGDKYYE
jgi:hypothetical protein